MDYTKSAEIMRIAQGRLRWIVQKALDKDGLHIVKGIKFDNGVRKFL